MWGIKVFKDEVTLNRLKRSQNCVWDLASLITVADLEIFRGGFSFTKTPAKLEVKTKKKKKKKVFTSFLDYLFPAAVSLPSSTAPKLTH